jgi:hypothetical protein
MPNLIKGLNQHVLKYTTRLKNGLKVKSRVRYVVGAQHAKGGYGK